MEDFETCLGNFFWANSSIFYYSSVYSHSYLQIYGSSCVKKLGHLRLLKLGFQTCKSSITNLKNNHLKKGSDWKLEVRIAATIMKFRLRMVRKSFVEVTVTCCSSELKAGQSHWTIHLNSDLLWLASCACKSWTATRIDLDNLRIASLTFDYSAICEWTTTWSVHFRGAFKTMIELSSARIADLCVGRNICGWAKQTSSKRTVTWRLVE